MTNPKYTLSKLSLSLAFRTLPMRTPTSLQLVPPLRRANTDPLEHAGRTTPSLRRANTLPIDADEDATRAEQSAGRRTHPESACAVDQGAGDADLSSCPHSKFARWGTRGGVLPRQNSLPVTWRDGGMALMAETMLEDAAWLDEHSARAKALETELERKRRAVGLVSIELDDPHEEGAADCAASALLAVCAARPERGAGTQDYVVSGTHHVTPSARAEDTCAFSEFIDADGSPSAMKSTLAVLRRAADAER
jgi:hypothetical protein